MTEDRSGIIVTTADVRALGWCFSGSREWAKRHGLSWAEFVQSGLPVEVFDALHDGFADTLAAKARLRAAR